MTAASPRALAVALTSASALAFEILLVRVFAIEQFYHFAYMAIGVAMLGYGAAGTVVALARPRAPATLDRWLAWSALATAMALLGAPLIADVVALDATQLAVDRRQWLRLGVVYLALAVPFGAAALVTLLGINRERSRPGAIYGASFLGAGLGAAVAVAALGVVGPDRAPVIPAALAAAGALAAARTVESRRVHTWTGVACAALTLACAAAPPWRVSITPYKGLPQVESYPDARRVAQATSPVGWVVAVEADAFRHAPGLSLAYRGAFSRQTALFVDGELAGAASSWASAPGSEAVLEWLPTALPYALGARDSVLVIGAGGGTEVWTAVAHGARSVAAVELHPALATLQRDRTSVPEGWDPGSVTWITGDARGAIAATRHGFDLITIGPAGGFGTAAAGVHSLSEDYLHTVDAYAAYLARLRPAGVLAVTRWLATPPRENVRVVLTAARALRRVAPGRAADGLVVLRSWGTVTTLVKPDGYTDAELMALEGWAETRQFDIDWAPGLERPSERFHYLSEPTLFQAARAGLRGDDSERAFVGAYPFAVEPVGDARPYPHLFLDFGRTVRLLRVGVGQWLPFAEWGYLALLATLAQAVAAAVVLLLAPAFVRTRSSGGPRLGSVLMYFAAIGFAYLAAEIAAIQQLVLLLGHPVYAVAGVLVIVLVCSGAGSIWSDRLEPSRARSGALALAVVLLAAAALLLAVVHALQGAPLVARGLAGAIVLGPTAFLMGTPFPLGLRALTGGDQVRTAWAWSANGFASVVAGPLAALIALEFGTPLLLAAAAAAYALSGLVLARAPQGRALSGPTVP